MCDVWWVMRVYDGVIEECTEWMCASNTHLLMHSEARIHALTHPLTRTHSHTLTCMHTHTDTYIYVHRCMRTIMCAVSERLSLCTISV
jgi:hypothetical protein